MNVVNVKDVWIYLVSNVIQQNILNSCRRNKCMFLTYGVILLSQQLLWELNEITELLFVILEENH